MSEELLAKKIKDTEDRDKRLRSLKRLAMINSGIWAISIIALIFIIQDYPGAKGLFPILAAGTALQGRSKIRAGLASESCFCSHLAA